MISTVVITLRLRNYYDVIIYFKTSSDGEEGADGDNREKTETR